MKEADANILFELSLLKRGQHYTAQELADILGASEVTTNKAMQRMSQYGWVDRVGRVARGQHQYAITEQGRVAVAKNGQTAYQAVRRAAGALSNGHTDAARWILTRYLPQVVGQ